MLKNVQNAIQIKTEFYLVTRKENVNVILDGMIMGILKIVANVIILGKFTLYCHILQSSEIEFDSCNASEDKNCLKCNGDLHRALKSEGSKNYCKCIPGYYEDN